MIRIDRGAEPAELTRQRERRLAELRLAWLQDGVDTNQPGAVAAFAAKHKTSIDTGYRAAADTLLRRCHSKCAYCEAEVKLSDEIDHFRPRRPEFAGKNAKTLIHPGYFWLTWTWENLLYTCSTCHGPKGNAFAVTGDRLAPWSADLSSENAKLLDPSREDPTGVLSFRRDSRGKWVVHGQGDRAAATVKAFGLGVHKDRYKEHLFFLNRELQECRNAAGDATAPTQSAEFDRLWNRLVVHFVEREETRFRALSRAHIQDVMGDLMALFKLKLPDLANATPPPVPGPLFTKNDDFDGIDEILEMSIRAMNSDYRTAAAKKRILLHWVRAGGGHLSELLALSPELVKNNAERAALEGQLADLATAGHLDWDPETKLASQTQADAIESLLDQLLNQ